MCVCGATFESTVLFLALHSFLGKKNWFLLVILTNISLVLIALTSYYIVVGHLNVFCDVPHSVSPEIPTGVLGIFYWFACFYMFRNQNLSWLVMIEYAFLPSEKSC